MPTLTASKVPTGSPVLTLTCAIVRPIPKEQVELRRAVDLTTSNAFEGHGFGKLLPPRDARGEKEADAFAGRVKAAVEAS